MTETSKPRFTRVQWIQVTAIIISLIAVLITFTGVNLQTISSGISRLVSPTADFTIYSYSTPQTLPWQALYSLNPSSEYYVATSIHLGTGTQYVGNPLYFSISFDNKGKNSVSEPYVSIYLADMFSREWALWNRSLTNNEFSNGFSLAYNFPALDRKTTGAWFVWALLYDNATGQLVSVNSSEFNATDNVPPPAWVDYLSFGAVVVAIVVVTIGIALKAVRDRKKAQIKRLKRAEKEMNKDKKEEKEKASGS